MRPDLLRCPITHGPVSLCSASELGLRSDAVQAVGTGTFTPIGLTDTVATHDGTIVYPVVDDIPVLLVPEALHRVGTTVSVDAPTAVDAPPYAEAYQEMALYGSRAEQAIEQLTEDEFVRRALAIGVLDGEAMDRFPEPTDRWFGRGSTVNAQYRCFRHLAPVRDRTALQIGGSGTHALTFLLAGAAHATLVSPVLPELRLARQLAHRLRLTDRLTLVDAVAEQLPLHDATIDVVYAGSTVHHTVTDRAFAEISRVLRAGGRFASVDVWDAPLHGIGTRIFGKAGGNQFCHPLDDARIAPAFDHFAQVEVSHHGALMRYPLAVLQRLGVRPSPATGWKLAAWEDRIADRSRLVSRHASLVAICATR